jgi:hypothetical protein
MNKQILVSSLKRLYQNGRVTKDSLRSMVEKGQIDGGNYREITGDNYD